MNRTPLLPRGLGVRQSHAALNSAPAPNVTKSCESMALFRAALRHQFRAEHAECVQWKWIGKRHLPANIGHVSSRRPTREVRAGFHLIRSRAATHDTCEESAAAIHTRRHQRRRKGNAAGNPVHDDIVDLLSWS